MRRQNRLHPESVEAIFHRSTQRKLGLHVRTCVCKTQCIVLPIRRQSIRFTKAREIAPNDRGRVLFLGFGLQAKNWRPAAILSRTTEPARHPKRRSIHLRPFAMIHLYSTGHCSNPDRASKAPMSKRNSFKYLGNLKSAFLP